MDIAAMSIDMSLAKVAQEVSLTMLKKSMDASQAQALTLISDMLPTARQAPPSRGFGDILDIRV